MHLARRRSYRTLTSFTSLLGEESQGEEEVSPEPRGRQRQASESGSDQGAFSGSSCRLLVSDLSAQFLGQDKRALSTMQKSLIRPRATRRMRGALRQARRPLDAEGEPWLWWTLTMTSECEARSFPAPNDVPNIVIQAHMQGLQLVPGSPGAV